MPKPQKPISPDLAFLQQRLTEWRSTQPKRSRLPEHLWDEIVKLAQTHGLHRTSRALGVDYASLKRRLISEPNESNSIVPSFVELTPAPVSRAGCVVELLRIESNANVDWTQLLQAWRHRGA
jgi:hypothetical protein